MDLEESLVGKSSRSSSHSRTPWIVAFVIALVLFVGTLVTLIVVITLPTPAPSESSSEHHEGPHETVSFTEFVAVKVTSYFRGDLNESHLQHEPPIMLTVYDDYKWCAQSLDEVTANEIGRDYSKENDDTMVSCVRLLGHDNCYARTYNEVGGFHIPHHAHVMHKNVPCSQIAVAVPTRPLDLCDQYSVAKGESVIQYIVESGTNFPVQERITTFDTSGPYSTVVVYVYFSAARPEPNETLFMPYEGVTVYDFRDGKGDAGDGKSNIFEGTSTVIRNLDITPQVDNAAKLLDILENKDQSLHKQAIRDFLHLPSIEVSRLHSLPTTRNSPVRKVSESIPKSFDARENWTDCTNIISTITNQGGCGSCWAMSSIGVLSDRSCILLHKNASLSPQYLVDCSLNNAGCQGGSVPTAWSDLMTIGAVPESCVPFSGRTGDCPVRCEDGTPIDDSIKVYPKQYVMPWNETAEERVKAIQSEIIANGPVQGAMRTFSDFGTFFENNSKGIYHRSATATWSGGHDIRIIGWGTENDVDYWLCANSWGTTWGDEGFFRIRRGNNECDLEEIVGAGIFN